MYSSKIVGSLRSLVDFFMGILTGSVDRGSERTRLASLSAHRQVTSAVAETYAISDESLISRCRAFVADDLKDNYLRGQLLHGNHEEAEKHNRQAISQWLLCDEKDQPIMVESASPSTPSSHSLRLENWNSGETTVVDFADLTTGLGLDGDCLSLFIDTCQEETPPPRTVLKNLAAKKTTKDMKAMTPRLDFLPLEATDRQTRTRE